MSGETDVFDRTVLAGDGRQEQAAPSCKVRAPPMSQAPNPKRELTVNWAILVVPINGGVKSFTPTNTVL